MDYAYSSELGYSYSHFRFCHRVHSRRHERDMQVYIFGKFCLGYDVPGKNFAIIWYKEYVVEGKPLAEVVWGIFNSFCRCIFWHLILYLHYFYPLVSFLIKYPSTRNLLRKEKSR